MADAAEFQDRLLSLGLARVSEAAALASAALLAKLVRPSLSSSARADMS